MKDSKETQESQELKIETPKENWTRYPNCILDNLGAFSGSELKVLSAIVRKNLGFNGSTKEFSITFLNKKAGIKDHKTVIKAIEGLIKKGSIHEINSGMRKVRRFEILWKSPDADYGKKSRGAPGKKSRGTTGKNPVVNHGKKSRSTTGKNPGDPREKIPETPYKENLKRKNDDNTVVLSSFFFEKFLPEKFRSAKSIHNMLNRHLKAGKSEETIQKYILYAAKNSTAGKINPFRAYLDKAISQEWEIDEQEVSQPVVKIEDGQFIRMVENGQRFKVTDGIVITDTGTIPKGMLIQMVLKGRAEIEEAA